MKTIAVIGNPKRIAEFKNRISIDNIEYLDEHTVLDAGAGYDCVIDLCLDQPSRSFSNYANYKGLLIGCAVKQSLSEIAQGHALNCQFAGLNALPTFIDRPRWEFSLHNATEETIASLCQLLGVEYDIVEDRVGMVTPRIVCMIINEACFVLQEGTADISGVDLAMKLGTNYPQGPFTWADNMGVHNVYDVINNLHKDTNDGRYKVAPLLKQYYLRGKKFYNNTSA